MERRARLQRARQESGGFRAWKREGSIVLLTAPIAFFLLPAFGFDEFGFEHFAGVGITALLAAAAFPVLDVGWKYARLPVRDLEAETRQLGARLTELERQAGVSTDDVRQALVELRTEVQHAVQTIEPAQSRGRFWKVSEGVWPDDKAWKRHRSMLSRSSRWQKVYERCSAAYTHLDRVVSLRSFRLFKGSAVRPDDDLPSALQELRAADQLLGHEIDTLDGEAARGRP